MGQSLHYIYAHFIWSTKNRQPLISQDLSSELYRYLATVIKAKGAVPIVIGGYKDHIHVLARISPKDGYMKLVEAMKSSSSKWMKSKDPSLSNFYWQGGYGAFPVGLDQVKMITNYIGNQWEHHNQRSFKEEYLSLLQKFEIPFDDRYIWD